MEQSSPTHEKIILDAQVETEPERARIEYEDIYFTNPMQKVQGEGVEFIKFSPRDAEWYVNTITGAETERLLKLAPEVGPKLLELLTK